MRIQKVFEHNWHPETTNYTYYGKLLTHIEVNYTNFDEVESAGSLYFFYNVQYRPAKIIFNSETCTNSHNLPSDIVGIVDSIYALVVEYKRNEWLQTMLTRAETTTLSAALHKRRNRAAGVIL